MSYTKNLQKHLQNFTKNTTLQDLIPDGSFKDLLVAVCQQTSTELEMLYLPVLTAVSGMMGMSVASTHKNIAFSVPNILWTVVAAAPGENKIH